MKRDAPSQALATEKDAVSAQGHHHAAQVGQQRAGQGYGRLDNVLQLGRQLCRQQGGKRVA